MDTTFSLNNIDLIKLVFSTGIITTILNQGISSFREARKEKAGNENSRQYSSIRISVALEKYAIKCFDNITKTNLCYVTNGELGETFSEIPNFEKFSDDISWRLIDLNLCTLILTLENEIKISNSKCNGDLVKYECGCDDYMSEMIDLYSKEVGKCGYMALSYAIQLRKHYKLPTLESSEVYMKTLKKYYDLCTKDKIGK